MFRSAEPALERHVEFLVEDSERQSHRVLAGKLAHDVDHVIAGPVVPARAGLRVPVDVQRKRHRARRDPGAAHRQRILEPHPKRVAGCCTGKVDPLVLVEVDAQHAPIAPSSASHHQPASFVRAG